MFSRLIRATVPALLVVVLAAAVTLVVSPEARAAVQTLLNFNGVSVTVGDDGKLVASGNTDAIVHQDDYSVAVKSDDGCQVQGVAIAPPTTSEFVPSAELAQRYPDLVLPNVPAGYTLAPEIEVVSDGRLLLTWADAAGHTIHYTRNPAQPMTVSIVSDADSSCPKAEFGEPLSGEAPSGDLPVGQGVIIEGEASITGDDGPSVSQSVTAAGGEGEIAHVWEAAGFMHLISADDPALTVDDLKAMQP